MEQKPGFGLVFELAGNTVRLCYQAIPISANFDKVGSAEVLASAPLVPSICWTIFAKRLWRFLSQELENV